MRRGVQAVVLGFVLALLASGCGGGSSSSAKPLDKADYVKQMQTIGLDLSNAVKTLAAAKTAPKATTALVKLQDDLRSSEKQLESMQPPPGVATQHQKLTKAIGDFADDLDPLIKKAKAGNIASLASTLGALPSLEQIETASSAIESKGYKIGG